MHVSAAGVALAKYFSRETVRLNGRFVDQVPEEVGPKVVPVIELARRFREYSGELHRLETIAQLSSEEPEPLRQATAAQIDATRVRVDSLVNYLHSAGWEI